MENQLSGMNSPEQKAVLSSSLPMKLPMQSEGNYFLNLPLAIRQARLESQAQADLAALNYSWKFWGRPNQFAPPGDWTYWLILAGRGFGKTRTGAEWVRDKIKTCKMVNLIGATSDDARDIMIEGESGILAICPPDERPIYNSHKRRLEWPNGAISRIFTADEPERLRGKQHMKLWADELCLVAGTMIQCDGFTIPIERISVGVLVHTRAGLRRVVKAWKTNDAAEIYELKTRKGSILKGTANHPVFTVKYGYLPLHAIVHGVTVFSWQNFLRSSGVAKSGGVTATIIKTAKASFCTAKNTLRKMALFMPITMYIISTATNRIANFQTCASCPAATTFSVIPHAGLRHGIRKVVQMLPLKIGKTKSQKNLNADFAKRFLSQLVRGLNFVISIVKWQTFEKDTVISVRKMPQREAVYNFEVEGEHEYFANEILTHNCAWRYQEAWDQAMLGLRLGRNPQAVITTTPKPVKVLKEIMQDKSTIITAGSTYDNRDNLAPTFFSKIITKYEGTRIGRQELRAEVLEDIPGALWRRSDIDAARVRLAPMDLVRTVVAIDPAASSNEGSDETGIIAAAKGVDGFWYVLDDRSGIYTPDEWARVAVAMYRDFSADRMIGEANNGGEMIEAVLRNVDPNVSYKSVRATKGKVIRAEPVAALYEQGRVRHVGTLAVLEDQMCMFSSDYDRAKAKYSPDRMDALVWAMTELAVEQMPGDNILEHLAQQDREFAVQQAAEKARLQTQTKEIIASQCDFEAHTKAGR